ncbi:sodium-dependent glucose transporter 1-like [Ylistrum balloti]|uniref:sodium-dependent glucose transporter 1-like n=1 Tax=Ylistrum balloti TaxID=509963 RepID=UPI002905B58B|nr:sodium-dependent glucose transporter 1-like [Ylistrum balloti]
MLAVWGKSGRSFMQAMYFSDSIGGVIAPVVTAQFLSPWQQAEQSAFNHTTVDHRNNNHSEGANVYGENRNFSNQGVTFFSSRNLAKDNETISTQYYIISPLFYAYMIPAIICLLVALIYMIMFLSFKYNIYADRDIAEVTSSGYISTSRKVMILINIGLMSGVYTAIEESFSGFLSTFCITQFKWTTSNSSYILCAFYSCMGMGRLVAVFWVSYLNPKKILGVLCLLVSVMLLSTTLCSLQSSDSGLWLSVALLGFVFAVILPTVFTWTEEDYFPVTGHISSYLNIAADCGATVNPVIIGSMMEHYSPMWFTYILLIESFVLLTTYVIGAFLSRQKRKAINGNTYQSMD